VPDPTLAGLRSVRGQPHAIALLARARAHGRLASAYLFEGPEGVGKERTARALAQASVCTTPSGDDADACGACAKCHQVAAGTHVDVITLAREIEVLSQAPHRANDLRADIVVEKVRLLQTERLAYQSHEGARWVIVRDAHELNTAASNALLKTLEEPPRQTHFVMVTAHPDRLLATIRSRCQRVRFAPLDVAVVRALLVERGIDAAAADDAARLSDGSLTKAMEYADGETLAARRGWLERLLTALKAGRAGAYVDTAEALKDLAKKDEPEALAVLALLERHFHDEALSFAGAQPRRAAVCAARSELVRQAVDALDRNVNLQMSLEALLVRLREVRA
jgi:DNA polymerase-3 subunit delta'